MTILPWIISGFGLGLCIGIEIARRAFKETANLLSRSRALEDLRQEVEKVRGA